MVLTEFFANLVFVSDHIGGCSAFAKDVRKNNALVIAHKDAALQVVSQFPDLPQVNIIFEKSYDVNFGNQKLHLRYFGPVHSVC